MGFRYGTRVVALVEAKTIITAYIIRKNKKLSRSAACSSQLYVCFLRGWISYRAGELV